MALIVLSLGVGNNSAEVRDRAFVQSIDINRENGTIYADVKIFGDENSYVGKGEDIQICLDNAQLKQGKDLFTGHTELLIFQDGSFSFDVLESLVKNRLISLNCPVIVSSIEVKDSENALESLKSYEKLSKVKILSASDIIKNLKLTNSTEIPILNKDSSYSTIT